MSEHQTLDPETAARKRAMGLFAAADRGVLEAGLAGIGELPDWQLLRAPEIGLVMVRGRTGGGGAPFNLGEVAVTRCAVTLSPDTVGTAYIMGRDKEKARLAALCDALWQRAETRDKVEADILEPIAETLAENDEKNAAETEATRVDFFTMVRGED
ncbi:alpha-D-ribose 1-methylphosphonate 5-triphosphate synthase subunit PhnG [Rhodobium orientis]|uniref:Phosphonate C-P lyase system protein PhnG n=1 Tax=Rhodobium orientis TaxID=34017 RepID=A0A327JMF7_9HYPH|nr:phosphonate C-P lyase system protein PhnG [Rhodobium orientis]MBB4303616.1 alpha-D-ribose 1-methylphosphonate 5-triphosphate synthase subunit PhnG [Rhodobium orientis]MBK5951928.1 phosphonate C-P lyase system protein PhnG [Rhodobium orientis]RAI26776.1 phosphonate C-P lyase system protein PhnG [Rhodobium orientis]